MHDLQKASMWKRISAYIFDMILFGMIAVGFAFLLSLIFGYDNKLNELEAIQAQYETQYSTDLDLTEEEINALEASEKTNYEAARKAFYENERAIELLYITNNLILLVTTFSILFSYAITEFAVPLLFKNGQTLGKKIFGIGVMCTNGVRISPLMLFIRTVLGKYTIETMLPLFLLLLSFNGTLGILGTLAVLLILVMQIAFIASTRTNSALHDVLANTVTVDMASQMIFDSEKELLEFKKRIHQEAAEKSKY